MLKACRASYGEQLLPGLTAAFHQSHCQALAVCTWILEVLIPCKQQQYCETFSWPPPYVLILAASSRLSCALLASQCPRQKVTGEV